MKASDMKSTIACIIVALTACSNAALSQPPEMPPEAPPNAPEAPPATFDTARASMQEKLETSLAELAALRTRIAEQTIPLNERLSALEAKLIEVRMEYRETSRLVDSRTVELSRSQADIKALREQNTYLSNLLGDYIRNFESQLHIAELDRYREALSAAKEAPDVADLSDGEVFERQLAVVETSLERMHELLGGVHFEGDAVVGDDRLVKDGTFLLVGPTGLFVADDGSAVGTVEQQVGSLEPSVVAFEQPTDAKAATQVVSAKGTAFPLDPTLGNAHVIATTKDTFWEHVQKGGPVMVPIFILAGAAFLVAFLKWLFMLFVRKPSRRRVDKVLEAVASGDKNGAEQTVRYVRGPGGKMLAAGVAHIDEPRDLIEEVMYEEVLATRLKLQRMLPFIAISAAAAPLLGLLGTVTGIINTFKLITVFGTGDVKMLSGGISEALITTEFGLIVAIPSLLLHAFLSRKARGIVDHMEKAAVAFVNQVSKSPFAKRTPEVVVPRGVAAPPPAPATSEQVREALAEIFTTTSSRRDDEREQAKGPRSTAAPKREPVTASQGAAESNEE